MKAMKNNLKSLRNAAGLSLEELATLCRMTKGGIWELEKGANPSLRRAYIISTVLDLPVYEIWPDETEIIEETITLRRVKA